MEKIKIRSYFRLVFCSWKLITFVIAYGALIVFGMFAGDPTWDLGSVSLMSILTFITAPWAVAILGRSVIFREMTWRMPLAIFFWLVSGSWSYDLYVYYKFGHRAEASFENLCISSVFYLLAGLFWNLKSGQSSFFEFTEKMWPDVKPNMSIKVLVIMGVPIASLYAIILLMLVS